jgi:HAD superfamily hydrolase (TIGR01484 family)
MSPLDQAPAETFGAVRFVLTDMDETLTYRGRLAASTYQALERLQAAGLVVIPVTAAPAGWCDQMARMWPVDGVIGENGGLFMQRAPDGHGVVRRYGLAEAERARARSRLSRVEREVQQRAPWAAHADDQPFRLTSLAYRQPEDPARAAELEAILRQAGVQVTRNNLWILAWVGAYDKLTMARRVLSETYALDIATDGDRVLYCGDSVNDAPMFGFFRHTVGVSTVREHLAHIPVPPRWITHGPGGAGFVEAVDAVLAARGALGDEDRRCGA